MQTTWGGLAMPAKNMVLEASYIETSLSVVLSDTIGIATIIHLPATARGLLLHTYDALIWYAIDATPGPIPPPILGTSVVGEEMFALGGLLFPNLFMPPIALPDDGSLHTVQLTSATTAPLVYVTALVEIP